MYEDHKCKFLTTGETKINLEMGRTEIGWYLEMLGSSA